MRLLAVALVAFYLALPVMAQERNTNHALSATVTASSTYPNGNFTPLATTDGDRSGYGHGAGGSWADGTRDVWGDWIEYDFGRPRSLGRYVLAMVQNQPASGEPTASQTCTNYGLKDFTVEVFTLAGVWQTVDTVTGNAQCLVERTFGPVRGTKVRVSVSAGWGHFSALAEDEFYSL